MFVEARLPSQLSCDKVYTHRCTLLHRKNVINTYMFAHVYHVPAGGQLGVGDDERVVGEVHGMTGTTLNACSEETPTQTHTKTRSVRSCMHRQAV